MQDYTYVYLLYLLTLITDMLESQLKKYRRSGTQYFREHQPTSST